MLARVDLRNRKNALSIDMPDTVPRQPQRRPGPDAHPFAGMISILKLISRSFSSESPHKCSRMSKQKISMILGKNKPNFMNFVSADRRTNPAVFWSMLKDTAYVERSVESFVDWSDFI